MRKDLTNQRFGRLTVVRYAYTKNNRAFWECLCDCGKSKIVKSDYLTCGATHSCGCLQKEHWQNDSVAHGMSHTSTYRSWAGAKDRCCNPRNHSFFNYGGRGIKMCERWLKSFENFLTDMGECPNGYSIDRIDNDGDYCPENCRWASRTTQCNNRRSNRRIEYLGMSATLAEWGKLVGVSVGTLHSRLKKGWPIHLALFTPISRPNILRQLLAKEHRLLFV